METCVRLIFINCMPISSIFGDKMALPWFVRRGFSVELWDLSAIYFTPKQIDAYFSGSAQLRFEFEPCRRFGDALQVERALQALPKNSFIYHLTRLSHSCVDDFWLLRQLRLSKLPYAIQQLENAFSPPDQSKRSLSQRLAWLGSKVYPLERLWSSIKIARQVLCFKRGERSLLTSDYYAHPSLAFGVGKVGRDAFSSYKALGCRYVSLPSPNILWQRLESDKLASITPDVILFVDESIGHAPDARLQGFTTTTDLDAYYRNMQRLFTLVETVTGLPVVVGASGKVVYQGNPFGREIIYRQTLQLCERAKLVLGHASSAMYHAICADKPILLLSDPTFTNTKHEHVTTLSHGTGIPWYRTTEIDSQTISALASTDNRQLIEHLFKEPGVSGDYRQLIADAIVQLMAQRELSATGSTQQESAD